MSVQRGGEVRIVSLQVGTPQVIPTQSVDSSQETWTTGIVKTPITGPVWLDRLNLAGDQQADSVHHGGPDKAVCVYPAVHYPLWNEEFTTTQFPYGGFGENLTLTNLTEIDVCLGDSWLMGEAVMQVSQPRQPCWKLAKRWNIKELAYRVQQTGRTGWYFRVLKEGFVAKDMPVELIERPHPDWSIARANQVMHIEKANFDLAKQLAAVPLLSTSWQTTLMKRIQQDDEPNPQQRLEGNS